MKTRRHVMRHKSKKPVRGAHEQSGSQRDLGSAGTSHASIAKIILRNEMARVCAEPASSLVDDKIRFMVSGLEPNQTVTLGAKLVGDKGEVFESHAHYIADKDGEVDVCRDSSLGGSYSGVEPMGLLWSMKPAPGQKKGLRLLKRDVTKPYNVVANCFDGHVTPPHETSLQPLSSTTFQRWYMAEGVKRMVVNNERFRGTLFIPPGDGPFPGQYYS